MVPIAGYSRRLSAHHEIYQQAKLKLASKIIGFYLWVIEREAFKNIKAE